MSTRSPVFALLGLVVACGGSTTEQPSEAGTHRDGGASSSHGETASATASSAASTTPSTARGSSATGASSTATTARSAGSRDAGMMGDGGGVAPFGPGDGGPCSAPVGEPPSPSCDPSDETASGCQGGLSASCALAPECGDPSTCEPFVTNPPFGSGTDTFRMRLVNLTAPAALASPAVQGGVVTPAVDLPASPDGGAPCGTNGTGGFNWLLSVDPSAGTVKTGGAPPSADPFHLGYCYVNGTIAGKAVSPQTAHADFSGATFSTSAFAATVVMPIFADGAGSDAILLPIDDLVFTDVTVSIDGNCIGSMNPGALSPTMGSACTAESPSGPDSCSLWHSAGAFSGTIRLAEADTVIVPTLNESLCVLLTGQGNAENPSTCTATGLRSGDFCAPGDGQAAGACTGGDGMWLAGQFAASAVNVTDGSGVSLCGGTGG